MKSDQNEPRAHAASPCDVAIAYRIYPGRARSSLQTFGDKLSTAEVCLRSLRESLGSVKAHVWIILDRCPDVYEEMCRRYFQPEELEIVRPIQGGNAATFALQFKILMEQKHAEIVYFAEDDYLYRPGQFPSMIEFLTTSSDVDFVTPYDHPDAYRLPVSMSKATLRVASGLHWRTVSSTCLTFATRRVLLPRVKRLFDSYSQRNYDSSIWHALTKIGISHWIAHPLQVGASVASLKIAAKTVLYGWTQLLFGRSYTLWSPIPSIATHLQEGDLAPNVHWLNEDERRGADPLSTNLLNVKR